MEIDLRNPGFPWTRSALLQGGIVKGFAFRIEGNPANLPVELLGFAAVTTGTRVQLPWETASELNNEGFEIEHRKLDAFENVGPGGWPGHHYRKEQLLVRY